MRNINYVITSYNHRENTQFFLGNKTNGWLEGDVEIIHPTISTFNILLST